MSDGSDWQNADMCSAMARQYREDANGFVLSISKWLIESVPELAQPVFSGGFLRKREVVGAAILYGDFEYRLMQEGKAPQAKLIHVVRGITLKTESISVADWIQHMGGVLESYAKDNEQASRALAAFFQL